MPIDKVTLSDAYDPGERARKPRCCCSCFRVLRWCRAEADRDRLHAGIDAVLDALRQR
jgi:hypothetical protein